MALFSSIGGHWAVLQSAAWASMLWNYSHSSPVINTQVIKKAAIQTFDGKHPCSFCKKINRAQTKEKSKTAILSPKIDHFPKPMLAQIPSRFPHPGMPIVISHKSGEPILRMYPPTKPPQQA